MLKLGWEKFISTLFVESIYTLKVLPSVDSYGSIVAALSWYIVKEPFLIFLDDSISSGALNSNSITDCEQNGSDTNTGNVCNLFVILSLMKASGKRSLLVILIFLGNPLSDTS